MGFFDKVKDFLSTDGDFVDNGYDTAEQYDDPVEDDENYDDYEVEDNSGYAAPERNYNPPRRKTRINPINSRRNRMNDEVNDYVDDGYSAPAADYGNTSSSSYAPFTPPVQATANTANTSRGSTDANVILDFPTSVSEGIEGLTRKVMSGSIVVFGLEKCFDPEDRRKIILFTAGVVFARNGHFFKLREDFYIVIPNGVKVEGELNEILKEEGFFFNS